MKKRPPVLFLKLFRWYCHPRLRDHIEGDLMEEYEIRVGRRGAMLADLRFALDVVLLFRPGIVNSISFFKHLTFGNMYKSYFTIGWRNLSRNAGYSLINIGGLALGIAVALTTALWVYDELHFNHYHPNHERIARVLRNGTLNGETFTSEYQPIPLSEELRARYGSSFKAVTAVWPLGDHILGDDTRRITRQGTFMETEGVEMLGLRLLSGSVSALNDPHSILLSASAARNLFGDGSPVQKILKLDGQMDVKVVGTYEDIPVNSTFHGTDFVAPWSLLYSNNQWMQSQGFGSNTLHVYVQLADGVSIETASDQIKDAILKHVSNDPTYVAVNPQLFLHGMDDWHLRSQWKNGVNVGGQIQTVWLFGCIGVFVLLLACVNFMNLSTARSERRAREVGVRKSMGSVRGQLVSQFFSESLLVVMLAFLLALMLVTTSLGWFNALSGKLMTIPWDNGYAWLAAVTIIFVTSLLAGSYPALYLSSFRAVQVLKGTFRMGSWAALPRKVLVVFQFVVSVTLIIGTVVVYQQIQFARNRPSGYTREGLIAMPMTSPEIGPNLVPLRDAFLSSGGVVSVAESSSPPTEIWNTNGGVEWRGKDPAFLVEFATMTVTPEYGATMGWEFVQGRDFSRDLASDSAAFVINEAAARVMGFANPVGEVVTWNSVYRSRHTKFTVIGVIRDMVMRSPYDDPTPAVYFLGTDKNWVNIRLNPKLSMAESLGRMETAFKSVLPAIPFDYAFVDDAYGRKFAAEERVGKVTSMFTVLAIVISCLGLFGLASFVAEQKTKEIGIRKVVGASTFALWRMLSSNFVVLVLVACAVAIPIAYLFTSRWLEKFAYRTEISGWVFALTTIGALVVTMLTVSYQALRAATANPVKSLRSE